MTLIAAATGHRPDKLGGYDALTRRALVAFAREKLADILPDRVISGMAQGWDQAIAQAALDLGIPFTAAIPFTGQDSVWPKEARARYAALLDRADDIEIVCELWQVASCGFPWALNERNRWMVDRSDLMLALWDGSPGGTANCLEYARDRRRSTVNVWPEWGRYRDSSEWLI